MSHNPPAELASTLQSASIKAQPDPRFDTNPSTAASRKTPVRLRPSQPSAHAASSSSASGATDPTDDAESTAAIHEIPISVLEPAPRKQNLPPLPDLRFEQSYLARVRPYIEQKRYWLVAWFTILDHVLMPLAQGVAWNLSLWGWRAWNTAAKFEGEGAGARIRRWWWTTNNWSLPGSHSHPSPPPGRAGS